MPPCRMTDSLRAQACGRLATIRADRSTPTSCATLALTVSIRTTRLQPLFQPARMGAFTASPRLLAGHRFVRPKGRLADRRFSLQEDRLRGDGRATTVGKLENNSQFPELGTSAFGYKQTSSRPKLTSALPPRADIRAPMSDSDRDPEAIFCWKFSEPIMTRGRFVGLFLRGVARQANETGGMMVGEPGGRVPVWKRTPAHGQRQCSLPVRSCS